MAKLFKALPPDKKLSVRLEVRVNAEDAKAIRALAIYRNLSVSEYVRRAALARRADAKFQTQIILNLRAIVTAIRTLHSALVERGTTPPEEELGAILDATLLAMHKL